MKLNRKQMIIAGVVVFFFVTGLAIFVLRRYKGTVTPISSPQPTDTVMPTVDSSVAVQLSSQNGGKQVTLAVNHMPNGTTSMEYEISYQASNREAPGIFSVLTLDPGQKDWQKTFDIGTCSSGRCIYDQVVGPMKIRLKFSGSYGDKLYEKDFNLGS